MSPETQAIEQLMDDTKPWLPEWKGKTTPQDNLMCVFLGAHEWDEHPMILMDHELLNEQEYELFWCILGHATTIGVDPWIIVRPVVKRAYLKFVDHAGH